MNGTNILNLVIDGGEWTASCPCRITPRL